MKKKYIPVREVLIFLAMLAFLLNYLGNKKDRQEVHAKNGVQAEESSQRGEGEETEEQNPNRESAGEQATDDGSRAVGEETPDGENEGKTLADWKEEIEKNVPSQEQAGAGTETKIRKALTPRMAGRSPGKKARIWKMCRPGKAVLLGNRQKQTAQMAIAQRL